MGVQIATVVMAAVSTAAAVLFGVWRIQAHCETRHDNAHSELRGLMKQSETNNEAAHGELRGELRAVAANVNILVGRQQERDARGQQPGVPPPDPAS